MCHILRKEYGPAIPVSARCPVFLSKVLSMVFSIIHPIVLNTALVQDSTLWIDSRCQNQIRNSWSEARISQNTSLPRESDSQIYVKEARYTAQCDKGLWGLMTTLSSVQVPVNLEDDPDEPLSPFLLWRHHACDLSYFSYPGWMPIFISLFNDCHEFWAAFRPSHTAVDFIFMTVAL